MPQDPTTKCPFTVLIDSAEQHPFVFKNIMADADRKYRMFTIPYRWESLGRYPNGFGDYSIEGYKGEHSLGGQLPAIGIERKSLKDCQGTILGWPDDSGKHDRRGRFEQELANLSTITGLIVVEASYNRVVQSAPSHGKKSANENAKILERSILAYMQDYNVRWLFCDDRRRAEVCTFRFLYRFHEKQRARKRELSRLMEGW